MRVALNSLSVAGQARSEQEIEPLIFDVVEAFKKLLPGLEVGTVELLVDPSIDHRPIMGSQPLISAVNHIRDRDVRVQWFIYVKNRARLISEDSTSIMVEIGGHSLEASLPGSFVATCGHWISFPGVPAFACGVANVVRKDDSQAFQIRNASRPKTVEAWLPHYEASPKHRRTEYYLAGELVAKMDLQQHAAQKVLHRSLLVGTERYGTDGINYYEFKLTRVDGERHVYHGYQIEEAAVPQTAMEFFRHILRR